MSTDCYAVVFKSGSTGIHPAANFAVLCTKGVWEMFFTNSGQMEPISQVWHCPSPPIAAEVLRELEEGHYPGVEAGCEGPSGSVLICRNAKPEEKP